MSLIKCSECGKEVSNKAESCPNCGVKMKRDSIGFFGFLGLVFFIVVSASVYNSYSGYVERAEIAENPTKKEEPVPTMTPAQKQMLRQAVGLDWDYVNNVDGMTGKSSYHAMIKSINAVKFNFPYNEAQRATLTLRTHPRYGKDVIFSIESGQLLCNSYDGCDVLVRFGDGQPVKYKASTASDNSSEILFIKNYHSFVGNMMRSDIVRISASVYREGMPVFDFNVKGFDADKYLNK